ncbi:MAG: CCA tRNA nucleotidyltransferase [Geminicoccaceae bacterium]
MADAGRRLDRRNAPWLAMPEAVRLFERLREAGGEARFVGGCVRDALLERPVKAADLDIVTSLLPDAVMAAARRSVPTGLAHGTVTVFEGDVRFEVTTLRRDIACDGRHAEVAFTTDFSADAARRDFTVNAMSCDIDGGLYDYFGGIGDLDAGRLRFVGDPARRIEEDYLRILRFFRFFAGLAREPADPAILDAVRNHLAGLDRLSGERVAGEMRKLLSGASPSAVVSMMNDCGVTARLFGEPFGLGPLRHFEELREEASWLVRLALLVRGVLDAQKIAVRLCLSSADRDDLVFACTDPLPPLRAGADAELRAFAWRSGARRAQMMVLVGAAFEKHDRATLDRALNVLRAFPHRPMPLGGKDLAEIGIEPGPSMGLLLKKLEQRWIESDFSLSRDDLLSVVRTVGG